MIPSAQHELIETLAELCELSPDVRFGQRLAFLEFLIKDGTERSLRDIEDGELLEVMERHRDDLRRRQAAVSHADVSGRD